MHAVAGPGRRAWTLSGLVVVAALAIPLARLITMAGVPSAQAVYPEHVVLRTVTIQAPVTQLSVQSYGAPVQIISGSITRVRVSEAVISDGSKGRPPAVQQSLSGGRLSLSDPACQSSGCSVALTITVPPGVTVSAATGGGPLAVYGVAGAILDSGGGPVRAGQIDGPLTVTSKGGAVLLGGTVRAMGISPGSTPGIPVSGPSPIPSPGSTSGISVSRPSAGGPLSASPSSISVSAAGAAGAASGGGVTGPLNIDTGDGPLIAQGISSATATITTDGGQAQIGFTAAPGKVTVSTGGGPAVLTVPGGPYALTADSGGGPMQVGIATDPAASRSLTVTSGGGPLRIEP